MWIRRVRSDKFERDFLTRTFALIVIDWPICIEFSAVTKWSQMHPNITKCNKTWVLCTMVCIGCVRCEKIWREFAARSFALIAPDWPICIEFSAETKWSQMLQNMEFCINCTSSAHFAPSLLQEQNVPKCTQTLRNATKHEFRVPWCVSRAFVAKSSDATSWHELLH